MLYLGHIISANGVKVHEKKIRAIQDWPVPRDVTTLRGFLGICSYCKMFVKGFSQLATPLTDLTKKGAFTWTDRALVAFNHLKETDHNSLRHFMGQQGLNGRQQRWVSKVHAYDFDIEYVRGKHNVVADALSGRPTRLSLMSICHDWKAQLLVVYSKDGHARYWRVPM
eukprot:PITA_35600